MKKKFFSPEMEIENVDSEDIITSSNFEAEGFFDDEAEWGDL